jgi:hypothetical protein
MVPSFKLGFKFGQPLLFRQLPIQAIIESCCKHTFQIRKPWVFTDNATELLDRPELRPMINCCPGMSSEDLFKIPITIFEETSVVIKIILIQAKPNVGRSWYWALHLRYLEQLIYPASRGLIVIVGTH